MNARIWKLHEYIKYSICTNDNYKREYETETLKLEDYSFRELAKFMFLMVKNHSKYIISESGVCSINRKDINNNIITEPNKNQIIILIQNK